MDRRTVALLACLLTVTVGAYALVGANPTPTWDGPATWEDPFTEVTPVTYTFGSYRDSLADSCAWCGTKKTEILEVHHIIPQRMWADPSWTDRPEYGMNDPTNLVTLCDRCHFVVGHRGNYRTGAVTNFWRMLEEANR